MRRIPLQTLPTFQAVAQLKSLRAAAIKLHLTHSAISQQIKLLEEQLGFALFDRPGKRVVLNQAGATFLRSVEPALAQLQEGARMAAASCSVEGQRLRITVLPSFAQHWLLPRMARWRAQHPDIAIELHTSHTTIDLKRDGFHAALRQGQGPWRGLEAVCLIDTPFIVVGAPSFASRLKNCEPSALAQEPLLGRTQRWESWFAQAGHPCHVNPVAVFNDMGLMVQAAEQGLGIAIARGLVAADAIRDGRLVQLSPVAAPSDHSDAYWLVHLPELTDWAPLVAWREWLQAELARSAQQQFLAEHSTQRAIPATVGGASSSRKKPPATR